MSSADAPGVLNTIANNPGQTLGFTERVHQAMANQLAVTYGVTPRAVIR